MEASKKKSVRFDFDKTKYFNFDNTLQKPGRSDYARESATRSSVERRVIKHPKSQLQHISHLIALWRNQDISIVLGNLGRQPFLLNYFLDLCFSFEDNVQIVCDWDLHSDYQTKASQKVDFLIHVEPYFGFTIHKDPSVKHFIVLTSHLNICYWGRDEIDYFYLHLTDSKVCNVPKPDLDHDEVFKPPVFHTQVYTTVLPENILLDVSDSHTAHEAYLRLLTGHEIIRQRSFNILLGPQTEEILKFNVNYSEQRIRQLETSSWKLLTKYDQFRVPFPVIGYFLWYYFNAMK